ncbi:MAG: SGNH/GDSL hydrolase family protein [Bacteroidales bacterium]|nr:SGNH/GDSL hydrolase family protein [Bacteroidales bacterium]
MRKSALLFLLLCVVSNTILAQTRFVPFNDKNIAYEGRIKRTNEAAILSWSGTSVTIRFKGSELSAIMQDADTSDYYNVIVDKRNIEKIHINNTKQSYILASGLKKGIHTVQIFKRTGWDKGKTFFYGFNVAANTKIVLPAAPRKRKIEFYGNSITTGHGVDVIGPGDSGKGYFENNYLSYAAVTARHYDAQYRCIARSGVGIMLSWYPIIMPEMYDRVDPTDSITKWDFTQYQPDVVVINLLQNDSWLTGRPQFPEFKHRFGSQAPTEEFIINAYKTFVTNIRNKYTNANIICVLGSMDATREGSKWPEYVQEAVKRMNDSKIYTHFFKYKNTPGHPKVAEQKEMADDLIQFIDKNVKW